MNIETIYKEHEFSPMLQSVLANVFVKLLPIGSNQRQTLLNLDH